MHRSVLLAHEFGPELGNEVRVLRMRESERSLTTGTLFAPWWRPDVTVITRARYNASVPVDIPYGICSHRMPRNGARMVVELSLLV